MFAIKTKLRTKAMNSIKSIKMTVGSFLSSHDHDSKVYSSINRSFWSIRDELIPNRAGRGGWIPTRSGRHSLPFVGGITTFGLALCHPRLLLTTYKSGS